MPGSIEIALVAVVTAAAWSDFRTRRIPNWITVPGAALGFAMQAFYGGLHGALASLTGAGLGLGVFIALYIAGGMGAGDVKLFSAVGALTGPQALILVFVGFKMVLVDMVRIPILASLGVIAVTLTLSIIASLFYPPKLKSIIDATQGKTGSIFGSVPQPSDERPK